jgi:hypothetical protein
VEFFLVFALGMIVAVLALFLIRPGLFARPNLDYSVMEMMVEEAINQLEERQQAILAEIEEQQRILLQLQDQIVKSFLPESTNPPRCWRCWNWKVKMWRKLPKNWACLILELNKGLPESHKSPKVLAVLELAAQGKDVAEVAKKLGLGLGEVELILELNKGEKPLAESS